MKLYRYGVPKYILTDNKNEWMKEFAGMCYNYGITNQFIAPTRPQCNGMVERLIKTIKEGLMVMVAIDIQN
jgi:transposase InsO family protein